MAEKEKSRLWTGCLIAAALVVVAGASAVTGGFVGHSFGTVEADRDLYNLAVRDGHQLLSAVSATTDELAAVSEALDAVHAGAVRENPEGPHVDRDGLEAFEGAPPFGPDDFAETRYKAFEPETVRNILLFAYDLEALWRQLERANTTAQQLEGPDDARYELWVRLIEDARMRAAEAQERQGALVRQLEEIATLEEVQAL